MINSTILRVSRAYAIYAISWVLPMMALQAVIMATCAVPHDFGMYNNLKTICHVWEGRDGYRRQATMHINSSKNIHSSHPWDYDGECEE